ncbi:MAG: T9SS type A sorting domain-containing protein, partial [Candidatus Latescibacteria bacterium]|nr:T9SS type A sorting domain-containing protein [Candidatus Latescibacterota bacterium]
EGKLDILGMDGANIERVKNWEMQFLRGSLLSDGSILSQEYSSGTQLLFGERFIDNGITESSSVYAIKPMEFFDTQIISLPDTTHIKSIASTKDFMAVLGENNTLYLGNYGDEYLTPYPITSEKIYGPVLADLNRDDRYEIILSTENNLLIYKPEGSYYTCMLHGTPVGAPVVADIDDDGYPEVLQCTEKQIYAFRNDGIPANGFPFDLPPGDSGETIITQPIVADLNNNDRLDIAITTSNMRMIAYTTTGAVTNGFPLALQGKVTTTPLIFKRAASDSIALAYITTDGKLAAHDLGTVIEDNRYVWPMYGGSASLASSLFNERIPSNVKTTATFEYYCYPNPITGNTGRFRIIPTEPTDCTITVFTADGRQVFEQHLSENEVNPGVPNEISMNATDLASGLYIARIKTRQKTVIYKLGVLK